MKKVIIKVSEKLGQSEDFYILAHQNVRDNYEVKAGQKAVFIGADGEEIVLKIRPTNEEAGKNAFLVSKEIFDKINRAKLKPNLSLGCDPEFLIVLKSGQVYPANALLKSEGAIGSDMELGELRPAPGRHEKDVVENLRKLIKAIPAHLPKNRSFAIQAHSTYHNYACGFHIHIGLPKELIYLAPENSIAVINTLAVLLDYFIGIPCITVEDNDKRRLGNSPYGKATDFRLSNLTFEYRTIGGFFLRHPIYAAGILGLGLCLAKDYVDKVANESKFWRNMENVGTLAKAREWYKLPALDQVRRIFATKGNEAPKKLVPDIITTIRNLSSFSDHEKSIEEFFAQLGAKQQFGPLLLENWQ